MEEGQFLYHLVEIYFPAASQHKENVHLQIIQSNLKMSSHLLTLHFLGLCCRNNFHINYKYCHAEAGQIMFSRASRKEILLQFKGLSFQNVCSKWSILNQWRTFSTWDTTFSYNFAHFEIHENIYFLPYEIQNERALKTHPTLHSTELFPFWSLGEQQ